MKKTRAILPATLGGIGAWMAIESYGWLSWQAWAGLASVLAVVSVLAVMTVRVRLATDNDHSPPKIAPRETFSGDPPPLDPAFRGMSGPPPRPPVE